jgi:HTH-type transcriptional regulator / antitoxin HigA
MKARTVTKTKSFETREPFLAIRSADEYDAAVAPLNALVDEIGDHPKDPRYRLIETQSVLIEAYDREHHGLPEASGLDVIRFLMEQYGLTQKDLPEIESQGVVSEVLAGRRPLKRAPVQSPGGALWRRSRAIPELRRPRCHSRPSCRGSFRLLHGTR